MSSPEVTKSNLDQGRIVKRICLFVYISLSLSLSDLSEGFENIK